jgi:hypothetical protein
MDSQTFHDRKVVKYRFGFNYIIYIMAKLVGTMYYKQTMNLC